MRRAPTRGIARDADPEAAPAFAGAAVQTPFEKRLRLLNATSADPRHRSRCRPGGRAGFCRCGRPNPVRKATAVTKCDERRPEASLAMPPGGRAGFARSEERRV